MTKNLYINTRDYQDGNWFVGQVGTIKDWKEQALCWCDMDGNEELYSCIKKHKKNETLLDFINDIWSMKIVKFDENNKEHLELKKARETW